MTRPGSDAEHLNETDRNVGAPLGGADAVEKTTFAGEMHGTEPGAAPGQKTPVEASVRPGGGLTPLGWIAIVGGLLALVAYAIGLFA